MLLVAKPNLLDPQSLSSPYALPYALTSARYDSAILSYHPLTRIGRWMYDEIRSTWVLGENKELAILLNAFALMSNRNRRGMLRELRSTEWVNVEYSYEYGWGDLPSDAFIYRRHKALGFSLPLLRHPKAGNRKA